MNMIKDFACKKHVVDIGENDGEVCKQVITPKMKKY